MSKTSKASPKKIEKTIYDKINRRYEEESENLLAKVFIKFQNEHQLKKDPDALSTTQFECIYCGGSYTKRNRNVHNKTNRHLNSINAIKNKVLGYE